MASEEAITLPLIVILHDFCFKREKYIENIKNLFNKKLIDRKKILETVIKNKNRIQTAFYTENGIKLWRLIKKRKLEGIIAKNKEGFYEPGKRSDSWLKIKISKTIDCIILGFTTKRRALTSLALGIYHNNNLIYADSNRL